MPWNIIYTISPIESLSIFKQNPKLLIRLRQNTGEDNFYEAHQLYKTIHFRCTSNELTDEALDVIYNGIIFFGSKNQLHCTYDLAKVFVETLKKSSKKLDKDLVGRIKNVHLSLKEGVEERNEFTVAILKWSGTLFSDKSQDILTVYQRRFGHADIHREFGMNSWLERNYIQARYHLLHSTDGKSLADMLVECHLNYGYPSECDLFLAQATLQYLCIRNVDTAEQFYRAYIVAHPYFGEKAPSGRLDFTASPMLNFLRFLLEAIRDGGKPKVFQSLLELYKPTLDRDPSLHDYLERVGQYFFGIKSNTKPERDNMLSNLFRMLTQTGEAPATASAAVENSDNDEKNDDDWDEASFREDIDDHDLLD